jgi:hypothetical protein
MLHVKKSLKILKDHFEAVTPEEFATNLKEFCPELIEEELMYLNSNGAKDSNFHSVGHTSMEIDAITDFISYFLPDLLKLSDKTVYGIPDSTVPSFSTVNFQKAQAVWEQLWPKVKVKEAAVEAVIDVANNPDVEDFQTVLKVQFKKLLNQDSELLKSISQILLKDSVDSASV